VSNARGNDWLDNSQDALVTGCPSGPWRHESEAKVHASFRLSVGPCKILWGGGNKVASTTHYRENLDFFWLNDTGHPTHDWDFERNLITMLVCSNNESGTKWKLAQERLSTVVLNHKREAS